jgi:uncharacterized protein YjbJ (UPF0337 family)
MRQTRSYLLVAAALLVAVPAPALAQATATEKRSIAVPSTAKPQGVMTWDKIAGNWKRFKGSMRRQWGKLTSDDMAVAQGRREILVGRIQARYGIDKDKADQQVDAWLKQQK